MWSDLTNKLYVAVTIKDDVRGAADNCNPDEPLLAPYFDDCLEFFIDGDHSGGYYEGNYKTAQQWWVTETNKIVLDDYPGAAVKEIYTGQDLITAVSLGANGDWNCEAAFNIYNRFNTNRKTLTAGDTIGWNIIYDDSDNKTSENGKFLRDNQVGWRYDGKAYENADYFVKLVAAGYTVPVELAAFDFTLQGNTVVLN